MSIDLYQLTNKEKVRPAGFKNGWKIFLNNLREIGSVSAKEKQFFVENLQVMLASGLPLDKSLNTLIIQTKSRRFKRVISELVKNTMEGKSFAESLEFHKNIFGDLFISMVQAGEISGKLDEVLRQIYLQIKRTNDLRSNVKAAMTYPVIVVVAMALIGIGMMIFVIPKITDMFKEYSADLPLMTKLLISFSNFIVGHGILVGLIAFLLIISFIVFIRSNSGRYLFHKFLLACPIIGAIIKKINLALFARNFSSLIKTDIPIVKTFDVTSKILKNLLYREALQEASEKVKKGSSISDILKNYPKLFPPVIVQMTSTGEETGRLDDILAELANFYEEDIERTMKTLPSIIEPVLMLILGAAVALMAVAIIMPMYTITESI